MTSLEPELLLEGIGFAVEMMQEERALELLELRRILEPAAAALAAIRITPSTLAEIGSCLRAMEHSHGETRIMQDIDFHQRIAVAAGNQTLSTMLSGLSGKTVHARIWHGTIDSEADKRAHEDHEAIYGALENGDPMLAESAALVHVANTERWYKQMLAADTPSKPRRTGLSDRGRHPDGVRARRLGSTDVTVSELGFGAAPSAISTVRLTMTQRKKRSMRPGAAASAISTPHRTTDSVSPNAGWVLHWPLPAYRVHDFDEGRSAARGRPIADRFDLDSGGFEVPTTCTAS